LGLFIGISFLSFAELLDLAFKLVFALFEKKTKINQVHGVT
jgi:hypothetical protein